VYGEYGRGGHKETQFKDEGAKGIGKDLRVSAGRFSVWWRALHSELFAARHRHQTVVTT